MFVEIWGEIFILHYFSVFLIFSTWSNMGPKLKAPQVCWATAFFCNLSQLCQGEGGSQPDTLARLPGYDGRAMQPLALFHILGLNLFGLWREVGRPGEILQTQKRCRLLVWESQCSQDEKPTRACRPCTGAASKAWLNFFFHADV